MLVSLNREQNRERAVFLDITYPVWTSGYELQASDLRNGDNDGEKVDLVVDRRIQIIR